MQYATILNASTRDIRFVPNPSHDFYPLHYLLGCEPQEKKYKDLLTKWHDYICISFLMRGISTLNHKIDE